MDSNAPLDRAELAALRRTIARQAYWYHRIELAPGVITPGTHDSPAALARLDAAGLPRDARALRVLDVGTRDGFFAFELERRGAEVVAIDAASAEATGFATAAAALASGVAHQMENVYDLDPARLGRFDLVLFLGVVYHLRNPLLALDRLRAVANPGALLFVESALDPPSASEPAAPLWRLAPGGELAGDDTSKWIPTLRGLEAALVECRFEVLQSAAHGDRGVIAGRAVEDERREFFRVLDAATGVPARPNVAWRERRERRGERDPGSSSS